MVGKRLQRLVVGVLISQALGACVAFQGVGLDDVPEERLTNQRYAPFTDKVSVNFSNTSVLRTGQGKHKHDTLHDVKAIVEGYMLSQSGFFLTTQSVVGEEDFHLRFRTVTYPSDESLMRKIPYGLYLGVSLATVGVVPYFETVPRRLEVEVIKEGAVAKRYFYSDYVMLITSVLALPWWRFGDTFWYDTDDMTREVDHNIVRTFLVDFYRDFMPKPAKPTPAQKAPKT